MWNLILKLCSQCCWGHVLIIQFYPQTFVNNFILLSFSLTSIFRFITSKAKKSRKFMLNRKISLKRINFFLFDRKISKISLISATAELSCIGRWKQKKRKEMFIIQNEMTESTVNDIWSFELYWTFWGSNITHVS